MEAGGTKAQREAAGRHPSVTSCRTQSPPCAQTLLLQPLPPLPPHSNLPQTLLLGSGDEQLFTPLIPGEGVHLRGDSQVLGACHGVPQPPAPQISPPPPPTSLKSPSQTVFPLVGPSLPAPHRPQTPLRRVRVKTTGLAPSTSCRGPGLSAASPLRKQGGSEHWAAWPLPQTTGQEAAEPPREP